MATPEEHKWLMELVQARYQPFNLSFEQAELVYQMEQDRDFYIEKDLFSQWEQWDFELVTFKEILNDEQWVVYLNYHEAAVKRYENELTEEDNNDMSLKQLAYTKRLITYYQDELMPALLRNEDLRRYLSYSLMEKNKFQYLKEEYRKYRLGARKLILIQHFRHYKTFRPNGLKLALLRYRLTDIWPDYNAFYYQMDLPTKAIADFLSERVAHYFIEINEFLVQKIAETDRRANSIADEIYGDRSGWHVYGKQTPEDELKSFRMSLLLIDVSVLNTHLTS